MTDKPEQDDSTARTASRAAAASRARRIGGRRAPATPAASTETPEAATAVPAPPEPSAARPRPGPKPAPAAAPRPSPVKIDKKVAHTPDDAKRVARTQIGSEWLPAAILSVAALVFAILIAVFSVSGDTADASKKGSSLREQVLAAAKTCTARENTYNYKTIDADETAALACTTGDFRKQVKDTFDKVLKPKAPGQQQAQRTQIDVAAIEHISENGSEWTILVFGQVTVTNTGTTGTGPRVDPFSAEVTMKKVGSSWLMSMLGYA